ncbi:MAG TPA: hypothetical protein VGO67_17425 [Verrucomicrobiae bacterium]
MASHAVKAIANGRADGASRRIGLGIAIAFGFVAAALPTIAQTQANAETNASPATNSPVAKADSSSDDSLGKGPFEMRAGPFKFHPRVTAGMIYDDNILLNGTGKEADEEWVIHPAIQAVAGDDAALIDYRDNKYDILGLNPGTFIVQQPDAWPGKFLVIDYGPQFQLFDKYTANNHVDQLGTLNLIWPVGKLILGLKQDYNLSKTEIVEFDQRTTVETINTALSAAYQLSEATSIESNFRRIGIGYDQAGLTGYTEYNTEDWFNYQVSEEMPVSLGVLAGEDVVTKHQSQTYEQLRARARYNYTEKLVFDASVGAELRQYQSKSTDTLNPVFTVAGEYRPAVRTSLRLSGFRQLYASIFNGYNYTATGAALEVRQGITERFTAAVSGGYYNLEFIGVVPNTTDYTGEYHFARASLDAKILRHLSGQIFYQYLGTKSQSVNSIVDNQTGFQLTLSY